MTINADIRAGLALLPPQMGTLPARIMLRAINLQENPRRLEQQVGGPARGDYQFEKGGGVKGVLNHAASKKHAESVCAARGIQPTADAVYEAIGTDPILAAALARLLLWTDPGAIPATGSASDAWEMYLRVWRPGAAKRDYDGLRKKFVSNYALAQSESSK